MRLLGRTGIMLLILAFGLGRAPVAEAANQMSDYIATPPFLSGGGVDPNMLLLLDNSASMYDLAYVDDQRYCFDDTYDASSTYVGYFDSESWYAYDAGAGQFEATTAAGAAAQCAWATGTNYGNSNVCITISATPRVTAFAAKGNFLNWAAASKFDIEKKILTGGKYEAAGTYGAPNRRLVMESRGCLNRRLIKQVAVFSSGGNQYQLTLGVRPPEEESFPPWENGTVYQEGDVVTDMGDLYVAESNGTSSGTGVADDTGVTWAAYTLTRWTDGATYPANSIVSDNGAMYITATGGTTSGTGVADDTGITDWASYNVTHIEIMPVTQGGFANGPCELAIQELGKDEPNQGQLKTYTDGCMGYQSGGGQSEEADSQGAFNHALHNCWYDAQSGTWPPGAGPVESVKNDCEHIYDTWGTGPWEITPEDRGYVCYGLYSGDAVDPMGYVGRCWKPGSDAVLQCVKYKKDGSCQKWAWVGGGPGGWDAAGYASVDACIEAALMDYCGYLKIPEVIDPTDQADQTGEFWNIPAVLIDSGVAAQQGEAIGVLKGYIRQPEVPAGLIQEFAADLRIGAMSFNDDGSDSECDQPDPHILYSCSDPANRDGGEVVSAIDQGSDHTTALVSAINDIKAVTWTPMAEAMFNAIGYYTQNSALRLNANDFSLGNDPVTEWCQANNILIITDGASTADLNTTVSNFANTSGQNDGGNDDVAACGSLSGSTHLDDLTYYAKQGVDLYPAGQGQLDGRDKQKITTHIVVAGDLRSTGADECSPDVLLHNAAQNGGTSLYHAEDPAALEDTLREAFTAIRSGASSGTVVSILSTSGQGEGSLYQAHFKPKFTTETEEVSWTGYLHSLWVDANGNLREDWTGAGDTAADGILDLGVDPIVEFFFDEANNQTKFRRTTVADDDPYGTQATAAIHTLDDLSPLWEAAGQLASRSAASRTIYSFVDLDGDGEVDGNHTVDTGEFISFNTSDPSREKLTAYLDLADSHAYLGASEADRVANLINYIRGSDTGFLGTVELRNRTADSKVWKLGDIIHSTPTPVGRPMDNFDVIYGDPTYADYYIRHKNRETVVYVGANDGMLHAFLAGVFHEGSSSTGDGAYFSRDPDNQTNKYSSLGSDWRGAELWGYVPQNLLAHLKWLADPQYENTNHVYYVDLKPRIFDGRIYEGASGGGHPLSAVWNNMSAAQHADRPNGWCTILVGGMRLGGGSIAVSGNFDNDADTEDADRTFSSAYFAIDITDPANPILLWERSYAGLGFTTSFPAVIKVDEKSIDTSTNPDTLTIDAHHWYLLFGSGPTLNNYDGTSTESGRVFLVDLATGRTDLASNPGRIFTELTESSGADSGITLPVNGYMGSPVSVDWGLDYSVNVAYVGEIHESGGNHAGGLYRLKVKTTEQTLDGSRPVTMYDVDPGTWTLTHMFDADHGVTAAPSAALGTADSGYSLWVFFGTGRYLNDDDKTDINTQYLYGIKDPYFNNLLDEAERTSQLNLEPVAKDALFNATGVQVYTDGTVTGTAEAATFHELKVRQAPGLTYEVGWYRELQISGERIINKPSIIGGILLVPSFDPNSHVCGYGGDSYLYAEYFETGTAYAKSVFGTVTAGDTEMVLEKLEMGLGISSSMGIHVGVEHGARGFVQQSTGTITQIDLTPALKVKSGFVNWREVR